MVGLLLFFGLHDLLTLPVRGRDWVLWVLTRRKPHSGREGSRDPWGACPGLPVSAGGKAETQSGWVGSCSHRGSASLQKPSRAESIPRPRLGEDKAEEDRDMLSSGGHQGRARNMDEREMSGLAPSGLPAFEGISRASERTLRSGGSRSWSFLPSPFQRLRLFLSRGSPSPLSL